MITGSIQLIILGMTGSATFVIFPREARPIRKALERAANEGLCEIVQRCNTTLKDILYVFQDSDRSGRIAVFRYCDHANG